MNKASKPFLSSVMPRQMPRLALAAATALAGVALTGTHALARGSTASLDTCTTSGDICTAGVQVATAVLYWIAAFAAITGLIGFWKLGSRPRQVSPMMPLCALLATSIALGAGTWMALASPILVGSDPIIPGEISHSTHVQ